MKKHCTKIGTDRWTQRKSDSSLYSRSFACRNFLWSFRRKLSRISLKIKMQRVYLTHLNFSWLALMKKHPSWLTAQLTSFEIITETKDWKCCSRIRVDKANMNMHKHTHPQWGRCTYKRGFHLRREPSLSFLSKSQSLLLTAHPATMKTTGLLLLFSLVLFCISGEWHHCLLLCLGVSAGCLQNHKKTSSGWKELHSARTYLLLER